jgi:hypothetical protein
MRETSTSKTDLRQAGVRIESRMFSLIVIAATILLSACGGQDARSTPEYFIPPTISPRSATATPAFTPTVESPDGEVQSTSPAACENDLNYVDDITIPDDTVVAPGQEIEKIWLIRNAGTCNWDADYTIRNVEETPPMGSASILALYPVRSGSEHEITINFIAPTDSGQHVSKWQAHDPEGIPFGQVIFIQIIVDPAYTP